MSERIVVNKPTLLAVCNVYCVSGTFGGYGGPNDMYSLIPPDRYSFNIIRVHTSTNLTTCVDELVEAILYFNKTSTCNSGSAIPISENNLPIILMGWSQGGYTIIKAAEKLQSLDPLLYKRIKVVIIIASRPEKTDFIHFMDGIHKYIICGDQDTKRRMDGAVAMYNNASEPKTFIPIVNGTHNFEFQECFTSLCQTIDNIFLQEMSRFV